MITSVIPTVGRVEVARAVESILTQEGVPAVEVLVIVDRKEPLPHAAWQDDSRVRLLQTGGLERCVARNTGAALARYPYLHFLDDDDYMLPGAFAALYEAAERDKGSGSVCWAGHARVCTPDGEFPMTPRVRGNASATFIASENIPLCYCLIRRDAFWKAGGLDPKYPLFEDWDMMVRLSIQGNFDYVESTVAVVHAEQPRTTTPWGSRDRCFNYYREKNLSAPELVRAVLAVPDPYWRGRATRALLGSAALNARQTAVLTAASRLGTAARCAGKAALSSLFWQGMRGMSAAR